MPGMLGLCGKCWFSDLMVWTSSEYSGVYPSSNSTYDAFPLVAFPFRFRFNNIVAVLIDFILIAEGDIQVLISANLDFNPGSDHASWSTKRSTERTFDKELNLSRLKAKPNWALFWLETNTPDCAEIFAINSDDNVFGTIAELCHGHGNNLEWTLGRILIEAAKVTGSVNNWKATSWHSMESFRYDITVGINKLVCLQSNVATKHKEEDSKNILGANQNLNFKRDSFRFVKVKSHRKWMIRTCRVRVI